MSTCDMELGGFLDVKWIRNKCVISRIRKRALSKVWKRLWCSIRKIGEGSSLHLQVQFNYKFRYSNNTLKQNEKNDSIKIPLNAIVHRISSRTKQFAFSISTETDKKPLLSLSANSETETQRWMADIRHLLKPRKHNCIEKSYSVSIIDNAHSNAAGLIGLYGDLIANQTGIIIKDIYTGGIIETFEWWEFTQFHLTTVGRPEDVKRICVMHTSQQFRCGVGELHIFCLDASKLLQDLVTQGRGPKNQRKFLCSNSDFEMVVPSEINNSLRNTFCVLTDANRSSIDTKAVENIYKSESDLMSDKIHYYNQENQKKSSTSIASEIYEEIDVYFKRSFTDHIVCDMETKPPTLPPRRNKIKQYPQIKISNHFKSRLQNTIYMQKDTLSDYSSYVAMSPQFKNFSMLESDVTKSSKENDYVTMR